MADRTHLERLTKELVDNGKLIEAGWVSMRIACDLVDAPPDQLREMRMAFFGGAQHLLGSILSFLDPGAEPTDKDLQRMDLIQEELDKFIKTFEQGLRAKAPPPAPEQRLGDQPIESKYLEQMNSMAQYIDRFFNGPDGEKQTGFVLLVSQFRDGGRANYISNINRRDVVVLLREQLRRFEGAPDVTGHA